MQRNARRLWVSGTVLKTGRGKEIWSDRILGRAMSLGVERGTYRMVFFFMLSCLIFKSSVERGIPSLAAAPFGPATFPLLSARAVSMSSFSYRWRVSVRRPDDFGRGASCLESHASSTQKVSPVHRITDLSIIF